jgi:hypothetical protein
MGFVKFVSFMESVWAKISHFGSAPTTVVEVVVVSA